jgi:hypothetical protein
MRGEIEPRASIGQFRVRPLKPLIVLREAARNGR